MLPRLYSASFSLVQPLSHVRIFATSWTSGFPVHHQFQFIVTGPMYSMLPHLYFSSLAPYSVLPHLYSSFNSVQLLSRVRIFATPWTAARQASLSIIKSRGLPKLMSIELVMPSSHPILCRPLLLLAQSLPASVFSMSQLFTWGGQSSGVLALASFLSKNTQDWSPLEWTGWISLQSKGLSSVFSNTIVQKHQCFGTQLSLCSNSHIHK